MKRVKELFDKFWWYEIKGWYVSALICGSVAGLLLSSPIIAYTVYTLRESGILK